MKHLLTFMTLLTIFMLMCDNRNGLINPRNNPYDSGGEDFQISGVPDITGTADSLWYDYDYTTHSGSIRLTYTIDDPNFPNDTVDCEFYLKDDIIATRVHYEASDSFIIIPGLSSSESYPCSISVSDQHDSSRSTVIMITTPLLLPPRAPEPILTNGDNPIVIRWDTVASATEYYIYGADQKDGPYEVDTIIEQPSDRSSVTFSRNFNENDSRYYIISAKNDGGENHSHDTLYARLYSNDIPVPKIDSVSKGTYTDRIVISWHPVNKAISSYALYRSESPDSFYTILRTFNNITDAFAYNDSVAVPTVYYYKLAAIDKNNQSSNLSDPRSGYISYNRQLIMLTVQGHTDFIELNWTPVTDVVSYVIYRSSTSCQNDLVRIASTPEFNYFDTVTTAITYSYTVVGLDSKDEEIAKSECKSGALGQLPAPTGIQISNSASASVLKWNKVPGAISYKIYRFLDSCHSFNLDDYIFATVSGTSFTDTADIADYRYYKLAAVDDANRTGIASACYTGSPDLLSSPTGFIVSNGTYPATVMLKWDVLDGAKSYNIYRSSTSCTDQEKLISTTTTSYTDSVPTSASYYYSVSGVDASGTEGSRSECRVGRVKLLPAPTNVSGSYNQYISYIKITWTAITDPALGYIVYRGVTALESGMFPIDTVKETSCIDSVNDSRIYYYRVAAYNKLGAGTMSQYANGRTLIPPEVYTLSTSANVRVSWSFLKDFTKCYIYRSLDSLTFTCIDSLTSGNYYLDIPPDYQRYYYHISLKLENGEIVNSNIVPGYLTIAPPQNLRASDFSNGVFLQWDSVPGATSYVVHRRTSTYGTDDFTKELTGTNYMDTTVGMTRFYYYVTAKNGVSESASSNQVQAGIMQTPGVPSIYLSGTTDGIIVYVTANSSGSTPAGFQIYRSTTYSGQYSLIDSTHEESYLDKVPDFQTYFYRATAYNNSGTSNLSTVVSSSRLPPSPPSGVRASNGVSTKYIILSWYGTGETIDGYAVYRRDPETRDFEKIGTTKDTIFYDSTMGEYYGAILYYVTAYKDTIESKTSSTAYGVLFGPPVSVGIASTLYGIKLSWSSRNNAAQYYIYRSGTADGSFTLIDSSYTSNYTDSNELSGNNYYKIAAVSAIDGEVSELSKVTAAGIRSYPSAPADIQATQDADSVIVRVTWSESSGATEYMLYRSTADTFTASNSIMISTVNTNEYLDTVPSDSIYFYRVKASNKGGESALSTSIARGYRISKTVPAKPIDLDTLAYSGKIYLEWSMPARTIAYNGFKVYRSEDDEHYTLVSTIESHDQTYYIDNPPKAYPSIYYYKVTAFNKKGEGARTASITGARN